MNHDALMSLFQLIRDGFYVALYAYGINRASAYAMRRLDVYGSAGDLFPPRYADDDLDTEEEEIILKRGTRDVQGNEKQIGFVSFTESPDTPGRTGDTGVDTAPDDDDLDPSRWR